MASITTAQCSTLWTQGPRNQREWVALRKRARVTRGGARHIFPCTTLVVACARRHNNTRLVREHVSLCLHDLRITFCDHRAGWRSTISVEVLFLTTCLESMSLLRPSAPPASATSAPKANRCVKKRITCAKQRESPKWPTRALEINRLSASTQPCCLYLTALPSRMPCLEPFVS